MQRLGRFTTDEAVSLEHLWAPWRREYILGPKGKGCVFCDALHTEEKDALVVAKGDIAFVMLNKYPYTNGHLLIAPNRHVAHLEALENRETMDLVEYVRKAVVVLKEVYHPDGFNLGMNLGRVAGAGVEDHLHFHLLPRWNGDTSFMSVCADTRVISESLSLTWETLTPLFQSGGGT